MTTLANETATEMTLRRSQDESAPASTRVAYAAAHRVAVLDSFLADADALGIDPEKAKAEIKRVAADAVTTVQLLDGLSGPEATTVVRESISAGRNRTIDLARQAARNAFAAKVAAAGRRLCSRCSGTGVFINGGTCYRCEGNGVDPR